MRVGFLGLGFMGTPMACNLACSFPLTVWNRSASRYPALEKLGASIAKSPSNVLEQSDVTFTMLFNGPAIDSIIDDKFLRAVQGKTIVNTSSVPVEFSQSFAQRVHQAGGNFIEMPVSGSKIPAEQGQLVGMISGDPEVAERIRAVFEPITCAAIYCGPIGSGLRMKYAVNSLLISLTVGLAESMNLARAQGLDLQAFGKVLEACPMASNYSKIKVKKMLDEDWSAQATIKDCYNSTQLIQSAAEDAKTQAPFIHLCGALYGQAKELGLGEEDMIAITKLMMKS